MNQVFEEFTGTLEVEGVTFTYQGSHREWDIGGSYTPPTPTVWEAYTEDLPANWFQRYAAVLGDSKEDVVARLKKHVSNIKFWQDMTPAQRADYLKQNKL